MPPPIPILSPVASAYPSSDRSYILSLTPHTTSSSSSLVLTHPSASLTIVDATTLSSVTQLRGGHTPSSLISSVVTSTSASQSLGSDGVLGDTGSSGGSLYSAGKDGRIVQWDLRTRAVANTISATLPNSHHNRFPLPLLSLALHERESLLAAGTELVGSESHIIYWDTRKPSTPMYAHSSTHSDDITQLSFLPSLRSSSYLPPLPPSSSSTNPTPSLLLLSASTDGLVALSDAKQEDEEEAFYGAENLDGSVASAGTYVVDVKDEGKKDGRRKGLSVWARSDMDSMGTWKLGRGAEGDVELQSPLLHSTSTFKPLTLSVRPLTTSGKSTTVSSGTGTTSRSHIIRDAYAQEEITTRKEGVVTTDYLIDVCPTLGVNGRTGEPLVAVGNNEGDIVLMHHTASQSSATREGHYEPSAFLMTPKTGLGHRDVVRCMYHDTRSQVLYTGSEDGVLSGWQLPDPADFLTGDRTHDNDGGDGREDVASDDEDDEMDGGSDDEDEEEDDDEMGDADEEDLVWGRQEGGKRRAGEVLGGGREKDGKRRRH